jgi:hypothetical protein
MTEAQPRHFRSSLAGARITGNLDIVDESPTIRSQLTDTP